MLGRAWGARPVSPGSHTECGTCMNSLWLSRASKVASGGLEMPKLK